MGRPIYETEGDRANESVAMALLRERGYLVCSLGRLSPCDFFAFNKDRGFLVEFKKRSNTFCKYPDIMIPEKKLRKCLTIAEELRVGFLYLVEFTDGVYAATVSQYRTAIGGRTDRNDPGDIERIAYIDKSDFKRIN